jgi:hypothetical protein
MQHHVEHGERHLREALVAQVREELLASIVHRWCVFECYLATLE